MGMPAARLTDMHVCPMVTGLVPHVGGPIIGPCALNVLIGSSLAARISDLAVCVGPPDMIVQGSATVLINSLPAARIGDKTVHGGVIVMGWPTVLIGDASSAGNMSVSGGPGAGGSAAIVDMAAKAKAIEERLDGASFLGTDDEARAIVGELSEAEIQALPTATRNRLMRELQSGYFSDDDKAAVKKIYSVKFVDPAFDAVDASKRSAMVKRLQSDPDVMNAKANWQSLPTEDRKKVLQKVADHQADAYGIPKTTITTFNDPPEDGYITNGYYQHSDGRLYLNTDPSASFHTFDDAMDTVTHENAHRYQHDLIDRLDAGQIKPGDPLYDQTDTFRLNNEYYTNDMPEYFTQPMENHSRVTGDAARRAIP